MHTMFIKFNFFRGSHDRATQLQINKLIQLVATEDFEIVNPNMIWVQISVRLNSLGPAQNTPMGWREVKRYFNSCKLSFLKITVFYFKVWHKLIERAVNHRLSGKGFTSQTEKLILSTINKQN